MSFKLLEVIVLFLKLFLLALINFFFGVRSPEIHKWCMMKRIYLHYTYAHKQGFKFVVIAFDKESQDFKTTYHHTPTETMERRKMLAHHETLEMREIGMC